MSFLRQDVLSFGMISLLFFLAILTSAICRSTFTRDIQISFNFTARISFHSFLHREAIPKSRPLCPSVPPHFPKMLRAKSCCPLKFALILLYFTNESELDLVKSRCPPFQLHVMTLTCTMALGFQKFAFPS